ncbi:MAG: hypothetical protein LBW85_06480 [Deltaproteobacteria bacterium]|jgi:hypothetical protein|nr:hypothetical protein [Deltaproteobacteria bacterium]
MPGFIGRPADVFGEVRRTLTPYGTLRLNTGDGYAGGFRGCRAPDRKNRARATGPARTPRRA